MGTKKGGARKGKPKGSRLAYDDTEAIRTDQNLKPVETKVRKRPKGKRKYYGGKEKFAEVPKPVTGNVVYRTARVDEAILRLIQNVSSPHVRPVDILTNIERLILGKYK
jgi:hypothetical protein